MTKATTLVLMHLDRADYDELVVIERKVKERLAQVTPTKTPLLEEEKWYQHKRQLVQHIKSDQLLHAVKSHKAFSGLGLKESKEYVEFLRDYVAHAERMMSSSFSPTGERYVETREFLNRVINSITLTNENTSPLRHTFVPQDGSSFRI